MAQAVEPSNKADLGTDANNPRFLVTVAGATETEQPFKITPIGSWPATSRVEFLSRRIQGPLLTYSSNSSLSISKGDICLVSCDPADYVGFELGARDIANYIINTIPSSTIIMYSTTADHCNVNSQDVFPPNTWVYTTMGQSTALHLVNQSFTASSNASALIIADPRSYTNITAQSNSTGPPNAQPTTQVAMIILYTITGLITGLFIMIIVLGALRAHRHPERYGPRAARAGLGRQSRAKGIARAMLETLPIVKFGDEPEQPKRGDDVELAEPSATPVVASDATKAKPEIWVVTNSIPADQDMASLRTPATAEAENRSGNPGSSAHAETPAADNTLSCSICTEDFQRDENVRVLPCNHKFHPDCVDPWLLNVSGTCPLCRIDLRGGNTPEEAAESHELSSSGRRWSSMFADNDPDPSAAAGHVPAPGRVAQLRAVVGGSREERVAALRRFRTEARSRSSWFSPHVFRPNSMVLSSSASPTEPAQSANEDVATSAGDDERGLARRLRETLRVRTRRHGGRESVYADATTDPSRGDDEHTTDVHTTGASTQTLTAASIPEDISASTAAVAASRPSTTIPG